MMLKWIAALMAVCGLCFGMLAAAGVFTVLSAVGLIPRFAGKTHSAKEIMLYESMVILGTISGSVLSLYPEYCDLKTLIAIRFNIPMSVWDGITVVFLIIFGLFAGMFIGCLALAIAEMLDSIPIFTRRVGFRHGLGLAITSMAVGKLCGSLYYFVVELHRTVE